MAHEPTITVEEGEYRTQKCTCCPNITARVEGYVEENGEDVLYYMVVWTPQDASVLNIVLSLFPEDPEVDAMRFCLRGRHMGDRRGGFGVGFVEPEDIEMDKSPLAFLTKMALREGTCDQRQ